LQSIGYGAALFVVAMKRICEYYSESNIVISVFAMPMAPLPVANKQDLDLISTSGNVGITWGDFHRSLLQKTSNMGTG